MATPLLSPGDRFHGLRYVTDDRPGYTRKRSGKGFIYFDPEGKPVRDPEIKQRLAALAIPPAYKEVWICADPRGHIQATARDERGRKQYIYHPKWVELRDASKFDRMIRFAQALPSIRARVEQDLGRQKLTRDVVLAAVIRLLDKTYIRVGNEEYARQNGSYGLTTIRRKHTKVEGTIVRFEFTGKSGKDWHVELRDRRIARIIRNMQELPGYQVFKYLDEEGAVQMVDSADVNTYLREISEDDFTAKDFRTWAGTVGAFKELCSAGSSASGDAMTKTAVKRAVSAAMKNVAKVLGNTPAVCRKSYVHPYVITAFEAGGLVVAAVSPVSNGLDETEAAVLNFLSMAAEVKAA